ncbi:hypothetical protein CF319_g4604 [Tilletia indica]|nr:hypothetical protein CF319_g4604 [Tilletia indica]
MDDSIFPVLAAEEGQNPPSASAPNRATISWDKRRKVMEWLTKVHSRMSLPSDVLWLALDVFHRYVSTGEGPLTSPYHTGLTCLWIASKYEERHRYRLRHFARHIDDRNRTRARMVREEAHVLATLQFRLSHYVPPTFWVGRISAARGYDPFTLRFALVIIESTVPEPYFATWYSKELASIAVLVAGRIRVKDWTQDHVTVSGYERDELVAGANLLLAYLRSDTYPTSWIYKKYNTEDQFHISGRAREWAQQHRDVDAA